MRSVFALLKTATHAEATAFLQRTYPLQTGPTWVDAVGGDPCLYIYIGCVEEILAEPEDRVAVIQALGTMPSAVVTADISGRHPGDEQVRRFVTAILTEFPGVAQDDYTSHCWTLDEVLQGCLIDGHPFFDYRGWYEAESDHS